MRIEINLLPASFFEAKKKKQLVWLGIGAGALVILLFVGFNVMKIMQSSKLKSAIQKVEEEQKSYANELAEIDRIKQQQALVEERERVLKDLIKLQSYWPRYLDNFGKILPATVWISNMRSSGGGESRSFSLEAKAISKQAVAEFLTNLYTKLPNVDNYTVSQITDSSTLGGTAFLVTFSVKL